MSEQPPQPPLPQQPDRMTQLGGIVGLLQSMTLTHVLILALVAAILIPSYIGWKVINDESMLNKFTSRYEEYTTDKMPCTMRVASVRGGGDTYSISTGFAVQGSDRYIVGVILDRKPSGDIELQSYCETLQLIVDHMRRPEEMPSPTFPGSDEPLIWPYPPAESP